MSDLIGRHIGPFEIKQQIGQGGMATVYRAYQSSLNRDVAIKVLPEWMAQDTQFVQRFRQEALAAGGLRHPNILHIHDAGTFEGRYYIVMDYVPRGTLADKLHRGPMAPDDAAEAAAQIADALDHAHRRGIVHRDLKPTNILLDEDGRLLLADFGIAQAMGAGPRLTQTGASVGTPEYMSPEQSQGARVDGRSDIYSLGVVLYQMLTGCVPFQSTTPVATLYQIVHQPPPPPRQFNPRIPPYLESIILRALAKQPDERFQSGRDMAEALRTRRVVTPPPGRPVEDPATRLLQQERPAGARGAGASREPGAGARRMSPVLGVLLGVLGVAIIALVVLVASLAMRGRQPPASQPPSDAATLQPAGLPAAAAIPPMLTPAQPSTLAPTPSTPATEAAASTPKPIVIVVDVATSTPGASPTTMSVMETTTSLPSSTPAPTIAPTSAPPAASPTAAPARVPASGNVVLDFNDLGTWRRGDQPYGTLAQSAEQKHDGNLSGKLAYNIPAVDQNFVVFSRVPPVSVPGQPTALTLWVYGDGSNHFLNAWIADGQGEVRQFTFGRVAHANSWQPMVLRLDTAAPWPQGNISGSDNGKLDYPISFHSMVLDAERTDVSSQGAIYFGELLAGEVAGGAPQPTTPAGGDRSPTAAPAATAAAAPPGAAAGHIAFPQGNRAGSSDIAVLDVAAKSAARLFTFARQPDVRGDGTVVFNGIGGGKDNVMVIPVRGGNERITGLHPEDSYPNWSPDGVSAVFYWAGGGALADKILIQRDMGHAEEPRILTIGSRDVTGRYTIWLPDWRIAMSGCDYWGSGSHCGIWALNSDGSGSPLQLTENSNDVSNDAVGGQLLYSSSSSGNWDVYLKPLAGSAARNLTNSPSQDFGASFSPDGRYIAFMSDRDGWSIWVMNADGSSPQKIVAVPDGFGPDWSGEHLSWGP